jgi:hypothetical protein
MKEIYNKAIENSYKARQTDRMEIFNKVRGISVEPEYMKNRKIRLVNIDSKHFLGQKGNKKTVDFNGKQVEYEDLNEEEIIDYYTIEKKNLMIDEKVTDMPIITMPI